MSNAIKRLREAAGVTQKEIADIVGVKVASIAAMEHARQRTYADVLVALIHHYGVSGDWLLTGEGPMKREMVPAVLPLSPDEATLVEAYRECTEREQIALNTMVAVLASKK